MGHKWEFMSCLVLKQKDQGRKWWGKRLGGQAGIRRQWASYAMLKSLNPMI